MYNPHASSSSALPQGDSFVYVKIPVHRRDIDPLHQRETQIDDALQAQAIGTVVGWGDSLGERDSQGLRRAAYMRVDIATPQPEAVRQALRELLPTLGAGIGTEIHYTLNDQHLMDVVQSEGWALALRVALSRNAPQRPL